MGLEAAGGVQKTLQVPVYIVAIFRHTRQSSSRICSSGYKLTEKAWVGGPE